MVQEGVDVVLEQLRRISDVGRKMRHKMKHNRMKSE